MENVDVLRVQPEKASFQRLLQVSAAEILGVVARNISDFCSDYDLAANRPAYNAAKQMFRMTIAVDIGCIEKRTSKFESFLQRS